MFLQTERLILGAFTEKDKVALMELLTDEEIKKTYMIPDFATEEDAWRLVQAFIRLSNTADRYVVGIFLDGEPIGFMNDTEIDGDRIELGYVISPRYKNKGYATEALGGMIEYLFGKGFRRVECGAFEENAASLRVMEKCGMTRIDKTDEIEYRGQVHRCVYCLAMKSTVRCVWEHNGNDTLLYAADLVGAFTRGECLEAAVAKMPAEIRSYTRWLGKDLPRDIEVELIQEKSSDLRISDADSDVIFNCEREPLTFEEYCVLKALALKSAEDFLRLYHSITNKDESNLPTRETFYGKVPRTAREIYEHTKSVNEYYFAEIDVDADNEGTILDCRQRGFEELEKKTGFLALGVMEGSYGELWSLRKVIRRFIWHDRIHAKAMWRMAKAINKNGTTDPFCFDELLKG